MAGAFSSNSRSVRDLEVTTGFFKAHQHRRLPWEWKHGLPDALLFREVGDPDVFRPLPDSTALVGRVRRGAEPGAAEDPRLIRHERGYCYMRLLFKQAANVAAKAKATIFAIVEHAFAQLDISLLGGSQVGAPLMKRL